MSLPQNKVEGGIGKLRVDAPTRTHDRYKHSGWSITINTNIKPKTDEESYALGKQLSQAVRKLLSHEGLQQIVRFKEEGHEYNSQYIADIKSKFAIELGRNKYGGRIHTHIMLKIKHRSNIALDYRRAKELIIEYMDNPAIRNIMLNAKLTRNTLNLEEYIEKDMNT